MSDDELDVYEDTYGLEDARKVRLLHWLCTPEGHRTPDSMKKLALELGVVPKTLRDWKAAPSFRAAWEKFAKDNVSTPDKVAEVIEMLRLGALDKEETLASRTRAAQVYLQAVDGMKPPAVDEASQKLSQLSNDELLKLALKNETVKVEAFANGS